MTGVIILAVAGVLFLVFSYFVYLGRTIRTTQIRKIVTHDELLQQTIHEMEQLIAYASSNSIALDKQHLEAVVEAQRAGKSITSAQEVAFWTSASSISKAASPVTIESLDASSWKHRESASALAARKYRIRTLVTLVALLIFQVYWLVGATVTSDLQQVRGRLEKLQTENQTLSVERGKLKEEDPEYSAKDRQLEADRSAFEDKLWIERVSAAADFEVLKNWNVAKGLFLASRTDVTPAATSMPSNPSQPQNTPAEPPKPPDFFLWVFTQPNVEEFQTAQITLTALLKYILPILYGALGASAYIVRSLATEIKEHTYSLESTVRYELRFYLGAVAGLSIAWFTSEPKSAETAGILQSLSPLALAFLAGYSVELLFSLLDRLVSAFSGPEPKRIP